MADVNPIFKDTKSTISSVFTLGKEPSRGVSPVFQPREEDDTNRVETIFGSKEEDNTDNRYGVSGVVRTTGDKQPQKVETEIVEKPEGVDKEDVDLVLPEIQVTEFDKDPLSVTGPSTSDPFVGQPQPDEEAYEQAILDMDDLEATQEVQPPKSNQERVDALIFKHYDRIEEDESFKKLMESNARNRVAEYKKIEEIFADHPKAWQKWLEKQEELKLKGQPYSVATMEEAMAAEIQMAEEQAANLSQKTLDRLNNRNVMTSGVSSLLLDYVEDGTLTLNQLNFIVGIDEWFDPVTAFVEIPHNFKDIQEALRNGEKGEAAKHAGVMSLNLLASMPGAKVLLKGVNKTWETISGGRGAYKEIQAARNNESILAQQIRDKTSKIANDNKETRTQLIKELEDKLSPKDSKGNFVEGKRVKISKELDDGNLVLDDDLTRENGIGTVKEYYTREGLIGKESGKTLDLSDLAIDADSLALPVLDPEKMDMFVSTIIDLKKTNPNVAKVLDAKGDRPLIDRLMDLTVEKELLADEDFMKVLTRNGLKFEEYVLAVVGSGSEAGRFLQQLGQIKRFKPKSVKEAQAAELKIASQKAMGRIWSGTVLRAENWRRGLMVSSLATAARNLQSAGIRVPMESMADVFDTALVKYSIAASEEGGSKLKGLGAFAKSIDPLFHRDGTWSGSFKSLRYMFMDQKRAEEFTEYILNRPEMAEQYTKMFQSVQELQKLSKGTSTTALGRNMDRLGDRVDDLVWTVNGPNRWQEFIVRRATFLSDLERQVKTNWGIDLQEALKKGQIQDILNDAPTVRPEGAKSIMAMMEESTQKALDVTYAKQPDFGPFRAVSDGITKSGLTVVVPFPRFLFNSMEYIAQNAGGAALPAIRRAMYKEARGTGLTPRDRQDITRNLVGLSSLVGYYQLRQKNPTEKYEELEYEGQKIDLTAQFPMRQAGWMVDAYSRIQDGTFNEWYGTDKEELMETWLGTTARTGIGNIFAQEMMELIEPTMDIIGEEKRKKQLGRVIGQYMATYFTPVFQVAEAQRAQGIRTTEAKDFTGSISKESNVPYNESPFMREFYRVFAQRGFAAPSFEEELPERFLIDKGEIDRPNSPAKLYAGLTLSEADSDLTKYLNEIGYGDPTYELGSKSKIPEVRLAENKIISKALPTLVNIVQAKALDKPTKAEGYNFAKTQLKIARDDILRQFYDGTRGKAPPIALVIDRLSRMSEGQRKEGVSKYKAYNQGRLPDTSNLKDMIALEKYAKEGFFRIK